MDKPLRWVHRSHLDALLTGQLRQVAGCHDATIAVGASCNVGAGESNWIDFVCTTPLHADLPLVCAVAGGVVSTAREQYNVLDS